MLGRALIRALILCALALALAVCSGREGPPQAPSPESRATVQIENDGLAAVAVYESGRSARLGTVMPGQTECLELSEGSGDRRLVARPVGGGESAVSPAFEPADGDGWSWKLATTPRLDGISLVRSEPCA